MKTVRSTAGCIVLITLIVGSFNACLEGVSVLGDEYVESRLHPTSIDTFSVRLSTVIFDTVLTSGTGSMLIGNYRDDTFGGIICHSFFRIGVPGIFDIRSEDVYDSLHLVIRYTRYSFGDTTQNQKISVHRLIEDIVTDDQGVIASRSSFEYSPEPIGSAVYTPSPNGPVDSLAIRISDDLGHELFAHIMNSSEIVMDENVFSRVYKGLALVAGAGHKGAIVGFSGLEETVTLTLHTSRPGVLQTESVRNEFPLTSPVHQHNYIAHDFSSTPLETLREQRYGLPSGYTGRSSYLQGGIGLATRVEFPTLPDLLLYDRGIVTHAELSIAPLRGSYNDGGLPVQLTAYKTDAINRMGESVSSSTPTIDELYHDETAYVFDVTHYLNDMMEKSFIDPSKGLLITLPLEEMNTALHRAILDEGNRRTRLIIHYLYY